MPRAKGKGKAKAKATKDHDRVKRPANAFILFRKSRVPFLARSSLPNEKVLQANVSKLAKFEWCALSDEDKAVWSARAEEEKQRHHEMYPDYKYQPVRRKRKGKQQTESEDDSPDIDGEASSSPQTSGHEQDGDADVDYPHISTREIIPIESGVAPSNNNAIQAARNMWPLCAPLTYPPSSLPSSPQELYPQPPYIATSLQGKQAWNSPALQEIYRSPIQSTENYAGFPPYDTSSLCIDPTLLTEPSRGPASTSFLDGTPTHDLPPPMVINNDPPHNPFGSSLAGPSAHRQRAYTAPYDDPSLHTILFTHDESAVLESLCRRTAEFLAATRATQACQSPSLTGGEAGHGIDNSALHRLFVAMTRLNRIQ